jgi:signal transduction histidine kinase
MFKFVPRRDSDNMPPAPDPCIPFPGRPILAPSGPPDALNCGPEYPDSTSTGTFALQLIQSQEDERKRLARELHDDIGQRLSLVASMAALLASQNPGTGPLSDRLASLRDELDVLCSDIHSMSHNLHSYKLQHLGLSSALKDLCRRITQPGFRIDLNVDGLQDPASEAVSLCLYRVAQEALNNALKHAKTPLVTVSVTRVQNTYYMTIRDSGVGFVASAHPQGLGLVSMQERLKLVNGQLKCQSSLGRGTRIWVAVPEPASGFEPHGARSDRRTSIRGLEVA